MRRLFAVLLTVCMAFILFTSTCHLALLSSFIIANPPKAPILFLIGKENLLGATDLSRRNLSHEQIFYLAHGITLFSGLINTRFLLSGKRRTLYKTCFVKRSL